MLSTKEASWDKALKMHTCCKSPHSYHKGSCPLKRDKIPGRASDPVISNIQSLKAQGLDSRTVARELNLALEEVNEFWVL